MEACSVEEWLGPSLWKKLGPYLDDELGVEEVDDMRLLDPEHLDTVRKMLLPIPLKKFGIKYAALMDGETADGETAKTATSATKTDYQPKPQTDYQLKPQPKPQPKLVTARLPAAAEERALNVKFRVFNAQRGNGNHVPALHDKTPRLIP